MQELIVLRFTQFIEFALLIGFTVFTQFIKFLLFIFYLQSIVLDA